MCLEAAERCWCSRRPVCWCRRTMSFPLSRACAPCSIRFPYFGNCIVFRKVCQGLCRMRRYVWQSLHTCCASVLQPMQGNDALRCSTRYSSLRSCLCHPFLRLHRNGRHNTGTGHCHLSCCRLRQVSTEARTIRISRCFPAQGPDPGLHPHLDFHLLRAGLHLLLECQSRLTWSCGTM